MRKSGRPRTLGLGNVVLNSFHSCISDASEELSWTPEMSFVEITSQPRMLAQKFKGTVAFKQLKRLTNTNCMGQLNKEMHMVRSNMQFIDAESPSLSHFPQEALAITADPIEFEGVHSIFRFPHKVESILPEGMTKTLQVHFFPPSRLARRRAHVIRQIYFMRAGRVAFLPCLKA